MTADELLALPDDGIRRELVRGELFEMPPPKRRHGRVAQNISRSLDAHVVSHGLGEVYPEIGYLLESDPDTLRAPDVSFLRAERRDAGGPEDEYYYGAPDLAVEVLSPDDRAGQVRVKVNDYLSVGTPMVVVVDPERHTVTVYRSATDVTVLTEDDVLEGGDVVPGWKLPVRGIFA